MVAIYTALLLAAPQWGKHAVGLEVAALEDSTRPREGKPRPIQMSLWYPAEKGGQEDLTFGDYVTLLASELGPASPEQVRTAVEEHASFLRTRAKMSEADVARWLARPMRAVPRAPPLGTAVPLVLVAQGSGNSASDQAVLCELLASHGFAVATTPTTKSITVPLDAEDTATRYDN